MTLTDEIETVLENSECHRCECSDQESCPMVRIAPRIARALEEAVDRATNNGESRMAALERGGEPDYEDPYEAFIKELRKC